MKPIQKTLASIAAAATVLMSTHALAQNKLRIAVVTPLTGTLAAVNVPGQNAARMVTEAINNGTLPAPYNTGKGMGGQEIELIFLDESGGNAKQVAEFRALAERRGADVVMGFGSAATCVAIAPVAEELKVLTVMSTLRDTSNLRGRQLRVRVPHRGSYHHGQRRARALREGKATADQNGWSYQPEFRAGSGFLAGLFCGDQGRAARLTGGGGAVAHVGIWPVRSRNFCVVGPPARHHSYLVRRYRHGGLPDSDGATWPA